METPTLKLKRHYAELSEKETDELASAMAELIVNFIKQKRKGGASDENA